ncbi:MAG TPA: POTRA domain-containing protein, partial [Thermoanaerobaculia bacterium]|nr:POTRA domain-containing protein [Thermoanaerobaculia bacterium]
GANALHVVTRESTVRRWLLFSEGDVYDPALVAESERLLRAVGLFRSVSITAMPPGPDGSVTVRVRTQDAWTVHVGLSAGRGGGQTQGGVTLGETNLLGTGRQLFFGWAQDPQRTYRHVEFTDPYFLVPHGTASIAYASNSDGGQKAVAFSRPFYAIATPWSGAAGYSDLSLDETLWAPGGAARDVYHAQHLQLGLSYGLAVWRGPSGAARVSVGFDARTDTFGGGDPALLPEDRRFRTVSVGIETVGNAYLKWNYVNRDDRDEDFLLSPHLSLRGGISPRSFGADHTTALVGATVEGGLAIGASALLTGRATFDTRLGSTGLENGVLAAQLGFVRRFDTPLRQTFVARLAVLQGWNLYRDQQIFLDSAAGLRGYRLYAFEGDRRAVVNLEQRFFSGRQLFGLISPGAVVFADAGLVGGPGTPVRLGEIKTDAGVGLRFGMSWAPVVNVFRIDAAYAFRPDPAGHRGWLVSFAAGQAF